ncbi:hypothetical protein TREES_T100008915 [Tupaia chinensis]|uniref:Uncharacterized protein n=1 Tax=Tupaia chinensis TaxID=246437 RepID=L9L0A8_TUPCH|nr:hypothetical protein TREES_T100008915 [Tupaia chinensis]
MTLRVLSPPVLTRGHILITRITSKRMKMIAVRPSHVLKLSYDFTCITTRSLRSNTEEIILPVSQLRKLRVPKLRLPESTVNSGAWIRRVLPDVRLTPLSDEVAVLFRAAPGRSDRASPESDDEEGGSEEASCSVTTSAPGWGGVGWGAERPLPAASCIPDGCHARCQGRNAQLSTLTSERAQAGLKSASALESHLRLPVSIDTLQNGYRWPPRDNHTTAQTSAETSPLRVEIRRPILASSAKPIMLRPERPLNRCNRISICPALTQAQEEKSSTAEVLWKQDG